MGHCYNTNHLITKDLESYKGCRPMYQSTYWLTYRPSVGQVSVKSWSTGTMQLDKPWVEVGNRVLQALPILEC